MTLNGVMALFCVISANSGSFRAHCVKVHVRYLISWWVLVHLGSVTARHYSSGRQPNFAALNRGRYLYSAGRPSRWAMAHILVVFLLTAYINICVPKFKKSITQVDFSHFLKYIYIITRYCKICLVMCRFYVVFKVVSKAYFTHNSATSYTCISY